MPERKKSDERPRNLSIVIDKDYVPSYYLLFIDTPPIMKKSNK